MQQQAKRHRLYLEQDADLAHLDGKLIASLGYGSQGHAQAQNLRDSGPNVIVGNAADPYAETARRDGSSRTAPDSRDNGDQLGGAVQDAQNIRTISLRRSTCTPRTTRATAITTPVTTTSTAASASAT